MKISPVGVALGLVATFLLFFKGAAHSGAMDPAGLQGFHVERVMPLPGSSYASIWWAHEDGRRYMISVPIGSLAPSQGFPTAEDAARYLRFQFDTLTALETASTVREA